MQVFEGSSRVSSTPQTELNVDLIFASSSSTTTTSRVNLDKFTPKTLERNYKEPLPVTASYPVIITDPIDMEAVFNPSKTTITDSALISTSTYPVLLKDSEPKAIPELTIINSSVPVIIAEEIVSEAMEEGLRSPKLEKTDEHGMISKSSFPVFLGPDSLGTESVKFGLNSRSASPEPSSVDLDQVFSGVSSEHKPRIDLSKYENRTLERRKEQTPVMITNTSFPVILADPLDMEQVFNPSSQVKEDLHFGTITNSSVPVLIAEEIVSEAIDEALRSPKLENTVDQGMISNSSFPVFLVEKKQDELIPQGVKFGLNSRSASPEPSSVDLDQVFSGVSSEHKSRIDLSKYEKRTLERRKEQAQKPVMITNSSVPVIITDPLDMDQVFNPSTSQTKDDLPTISITNSSVPVLVAEGIVSEAIGEALRSPKLEKTDDQGMISNSSFPVFFVDKKPGVDNVKFALNSRSASPEPSSVDLDQVFSGVSSASKPRIDLSKYENRTLERRKEPAQKTVMITNSSVPVIIADPLNMNLVFNPSLTPLKKDESSVPSVVAESIVQKALDQALPRPQKLEESPIDLDQVFTSTSSTSAPRVDLSKFEVRSLERRRDTPRPVMTPPSIHSTVAVDPLDIDLVFAPTTSAKKDDVIEEEEVTTSPRSSPIPPQFDAVDVVSDAIAEVIVADAIDEAMRSPAMINSSSTFSFVFSSEEKAGSFAAIDSASSLDTIPEHPVYPRTITHIRSSAPDFIARGEDVNDDSPLKVVEEEDEDEEDEETPLPVFARSRNPAYGMASDRPFVSQSEDAPSHFIDPISIVTDLSPSPSVKKIISPEPSKERIPEASIDLEEVFASPMSPSTSTTSRLDLDKFVARTLERRHEPARIVTPVQETRGTRHSDLPPSSISVDDIFSPQPPPVVVVAPEKPPRYPQQSESAVTDPMDDPAAEVDLDSVFDASFGSETKDTSRFAQRSVDHVLTAEFNDRKEAAVSTLSTLPSSAIGDELIIPAPIPPPRRSPRLSNSTEDTPAPPPRHKLISLSSFPVLLTESSSNDDTPMPPTRNRDASPVAPGVLIEPTATPPNSLSASPVRSHRRTDSMSLPRSRNESFNRLSESITEREEPVLTVEAVFSSSSSDITRPSVTVREDGTDTTVDIILPPPRAPPRMNFPPPPPVEEIEYEMKTEDEESLEMKSPTIEEDVKVKISEL